MSGALLQLAALSSQDVYLTANPEITLFKKTYMRYTNFSIETVQVAFDGSVSFGNETYANLEKTGDLISKMVLVVNLQQLTSTKKWGYVDKIGHAIIDSVSIYIGGAEIDSRNNDWIDIYQSITRDRSQKDNYNINEFVNDFYLDNHADIPNNIYDIINTNFNVIKNIIYNLYITTTKYYPKYNRFKVDLDMDRTLNPLIRFHLAQLRHQQTTIYTKKIINENNVFNYLCHSNNIKNIQKLFSHFATHNLYNLTPEIILSFATVSNLLENNPAI